MLETLHTIDWSALQHVYGHPEEIPHRIRQHLSPIKGNREAALLFLLGEGQDYGNVYQSTVHIIPFALEILADERQPGRVELLEALGMITVAKVYTAGRPEYSIRQMRNYLAAYDALERGIPLYLKLLNDSSAKMRVAAAAVLGGFNERASELLPVLSNRFRTETGETVQQALVEAISRLLMEQDVSGTDLQKAYAPFFAQILATTSSLEVRFVAARAAIKVSRTFSYTKNLKADEVPSGLAATLIEKYHSFTNDLARLVMRPEIVELLALLPDPTPLINLLNLPETTPEETHMIVRGLLSRYVLRGDLKQYWRYRPRQKFASQRKIYEIFSVSIELEEYKDRLGNLWDNLRLIADTDQFWQIPTNLLSVMFNLPDDREQLREFIRTNGDAGKFP